MFEILSFLCKINCKANCLLKQIPFKFIENLVFTTLNTGFNLACAHTDMYEHERGTGHYKVVELIMKNSRKLNIDT